MMTRVTATSSIGMSYRAAAASRQLNSAIFEVGAPRVDRRVVRPMDDVTSVVRVGAGVDHDLPQTDTVFPTVWWDALLVWRACNQPTCKRKRGMVARPLQRGHDLSIRVGVATCHVCVRFEPSPLFVDGARPHGGFGAPDSDGVNDGIFEVELFGEPGERVSQPEVASA